MDEIQNRINLMEKELALLKNTIHGSGPSDGGVMGRLKEMQEDLKKSIRTQNMLIGALILLNVLIKFIPVNL